MLYRFNSYTGKLSTAVRSMTSGLKVPGQADPVLSSTIMYDSSTTRFPKISPEFDQQQRSPMSTATMHPAGGAYGPMSPTLKAKQAKFQIEDGVPIHLKGGAFDKGLYYFTLALSVFCIFEVGHFVWTHSFPKKHH